MAVLVGKALIGLIKTALKANAKKALTKSVAQAAKAGGITAKGLSTNLALKNLATMPMSDAKALILGRLKAKPSEILWQTAQKEFGISRSALQQVLRGWNMTPAQRRAVMGKEFARFAGNALRRELGLNTNGASTIKDIYKALDDRNNKDEEADAYECVKGALTDIQLEVRKKLLDFDLQTSRGAQYTEVQGIDYIRPPYLDKNKEYTLDMCAGLRKVRDRIVADILDYDGIGDTLIGYDYYERNGASRRLALYKVEDFLANNERDINTILGL